ncbi:glycosyltransferase family 2 protein [unidentified bacterial endosymbiont]|uniref:glycosyltransferase family 2 protein n=1 Tax=unidentified bacterial endosymbiont TaxID=2355 RepID=UPI00209E0248|nr:glycosyltransferase family 2 protein [unidentified bacterial endosymbiont]
MDVAVVIPSYKVCTSILEVLGQIGREVTKIYVVDDACPDGSGRLVENQCVDRRVAVLYHSDNQGVGGAVITGYRAALADNMDIIVKVDGDGQMDPSLIPCFIAPILAGEADYTKGNRFFDLEDLHTMPKARLLGNALLSLITKISSGYWDLFDPTNGYTAIHRVVAQCLPFEKISQGYFFETDMLFRLNTLRAVVVDIPMAAKYGLEISHLKIHKIIIEFAFKNVKNFGKRIFYNYYLRDMSLASIELPLGLLLLLSGITFGSIRWIKALHSGAPTPAGAVMLAALPVLLGLQFILAFIGYDIATVPKKPLHIMKKWQR